MGSAKLPIIGVKSGTPTYSSTYFDTPKYNYYERFGNVVHFYFLAKIKAEIPNNASAISGLPAPVHDFQFPTFISNDEYANGASSVKGCYLRSDGILGQFAIASSYVNKYMIYDVVYIAKG